MGNKKKKGNQSAEVPKNIPVDRNGTEDAVSAEFMPPPEELARKKESRVKITITLNSGSVEFFKKYAKKNGVKYQAMINGLLDRYAEQYRDRIGG